MGARAGFSEEEEAELRRMGIRGSGNWTVPGALVAVAVVAGLGWWWHAHPEPIALAAVAPPARAPPTPTVAPAAVPAGTTVPIAGGNDLLKQLAGGLSGSAELRRWLKEPDLLRRLVAATSLVAEGESPRPVVGFLAPRSAFAADESGGHLVGSAQNSRRSDAFVRALTRLDPAQVARVYEPLRPYAEAAYAEVGRPGRSFDAVMHAGIRQLLATPIPPTEPELQLKGAVYQYADPALEGLNGAQKQLLRLGLAHARAVQAWLQAYEKALPPPAS
jgi:hypothetical protein